LISRLLLVVIVAALFISAARSGSSRPVGCADPDVMRKALKGISDSDWNAISETNLQSMWPTEISPADCNAGACQTLSHEGRVIDNNCECCELFHFQIDREDKAASIKERLHTIVIHYSVANGDEILTVARSFARAVGLSDADSATIKRETRQSFDWDVDRGKQKEIASLEVEITHQRQMWHVYLSLSRYPE
jgi:hypothetical protein